MPLVDFYQSHPLWVWLAIGGLLLAIEVATGSGWLLWPAAAAAIVALATLTGIEMGLGGEIALFAVITIAATLLARKFTPGFTKAEGKDINDRTGDLVGQTGEAVSAFSDGRGRILVDGTEWLAELENGADIPTGGRVKVLRVIDGARLKVKPV